MPEEEPSTAELAKSRSVEYQKRIKKLTEAGALKYPRYEHLPNTVSVHLFKRIFEGGNIETMPKQQLTLQGRIVSIRTAGNKLAFIEIVQATYHTQLMVNFGKMEDGTPLDLFKQRIKLLKRGDFISVSGWPTKTTAGELSLGAVTLPRVLAPSLVPIPERLADENTLAQHRSLDLIVNKKAIHTLQLRSAITRNIRTFFYYNKYSEVETPMLAGNTGGAVARPFASASTEFPHKELALRIAPELWLKRLVVGGMDKIFELGRSFRNEGLDATHNPEFTTCEAYAAYANLPKLIWMTEDLMEMLARRCAYYNEHFFLSLPKVNESHFKSPYRQIEFIPGLEAALGFQFPDLDSDTAFEVLSEMLKQHEVDLGPEKPTTIAKLLDKLAGIYIEPLSETAPIFIIHHPACMSPLSKTFMCPTTGQHIAARAEFFVAGTELANMYEEENDPFEQRRKFEMQVRARVADVTGEDGATEVDESYLAALECGLPPTGGWGCGIDRLVMLFSGQERISDTLSFGSLRNVVGMASYKPPAR